MKCPCCGFEEPFYWHYPTHHGLEMPYARIQDIRDESPQLAKLIESGKPIRPKVLEYTDEHYAYKYNLSSGFVRRREIDFWKAAKWASIPMEKRKSFVPGKQSKIKMFLKEPLLVACDGGKET